LVASKTGLEMMQKRSVATEGITSQIECKTTLNHPLFQPYTKRNTSILTISLVKANNQ